MRNVVVFGGRARRLSTAGLGAPRAVTVDGATVGCGVVHTSPPRFDPQGADDARRVLVRVTATSCNYRDRAFVRLMASVPPRRFVPICSEFTGVVAAVGREVTGLRPGDRVVPDQHYTGAATPPGGVREGVVSNRASREWQVIPEQKLAAIPACMPDAVAAGFALNAQTAYSMVRRAGIGPGTRVLVTAGSSNTSLALIGALRSSSAEIYASTTSVDRADALRALGVSEVLVVPRAAAGAPREPGTAGALAAAVAAAGLQFEAVLDPFYDLHVADAVELLAPFGTYVTCGFAGQNPHVARAAGVAPVRADHVFQTAIMKNLSIVGNCIGLATDLARALSDYAAGALPVVTDSVFTGDDIAPFLDRTFNDRERFGKVVYAYE